MLLESMLILMVIVWGLVLFLGGTLLFAWAVKHNVEVAFKLFTGIISGMVAGIIVSMYAEIKNGLTPSGWVFTFGFSMLFIGIVSFIFSYNLRTKRKKE